MIRKSTRWDRKERVNVESDLEFDGAVSGNVIQIQKDSRLDFNNTNEFTISLYLDASKTTNSFITGQRTTAGAGTNTWHLFVDNTGRLAFNCEGVLSSALYSGFISQFQNRKAHIICVYKPIDASNADAFLYINGKLVAENATKTILGDFTALGDLFIGTSHENKISTYGGAISNFSFFNRALTQQEISNIHTQGGLIPESAHESCVAHYPLTQRQYFKASVDFIVKHPQFALNDLVALDVVEQYNYAKVTPLSANHGELINFTDAEVNTSPTSSIKDFHNKSNLKSYFSKFNGVDSVVAIPNSANLTFGDGLGNNTSFTITGHFIPYANTARIFEKGQEFSTANRQYLVAVNASGFFQMIIFAEGINILGSHNVIFGKKYMFSASFDSTKPDIQQGMRLILWEGNNLVEDATLGAAPVQQTIVSSSETQLIGAGDNTHANADIADIRVHSIALSKQQAINVLIKGKDSGFEISGWGLNSEETLQATGTEVDLYGGGNNGTLTNLIRSVEKGSLLPELRNSLRFVGANNHRLEQNVINIDPNADFYTFMIVHRMADGEVYNAFDDSFYYAHDGTAANRFLLLGRQTKGFQSSIVEANIGNAHLWLATPTEPDELQVSFVIVDQAVAASGNSFSERYISNGHEIVSAGSSASAKLRFDLYTKVVYGNNAFGGASASYDGYLAAIGIWNRALSMKEMKRLTNNTLLMNPDAQIQKGLQQYNLFNEKTINGIEDLSGNGNHIDTFINYSVNELDPLHADYKFEDINELR